MGKTLDDWSNESIRYLESKMPDFGKILAQKYLDAEDEAILKGLPHKITVDQHYKWIIHGIGHNSHYNAVMSYFSSHELNILRHNKVYVHQHNAINKSKLFNLGIGIGVRLKKRLIYANQIGLIKLI